MTGGAGFSKQASQSFKDNHSLGQIRPKGKLPKSALSRENANPEDLSDSIQHRIQQSRRIQTGSIVLGALLIVLVMFLIFLFLE